MARLDSQVVRFKSASETAERSEEELKTERRKLQREVHDLSQRHFLIASIFGVAESDKRKKLLKMF